ncbi:MAG: ABC transporter permease [Anaerolineae bacterium]
MMKIAGQALRPLLSAILSVWLAFTITFFALRALPGDAVQSVLLGSGASQSDIMARREMLGLDAPIGVQYGQALRDFTSGSLGVSLLNGLSTTELIAQNLPPTLELAGSAMLVAVILGCVLGSVSGTAHESARRAADAVLALTMSIPIYWSGTVAIFIFAGQLNWLPSGGAGRFSQLVLPALLLGFHTSGSIARVIAAGLREAYAMDYTRTAQAKGLSWGIIWYRHWLPNILPAALTVIALQAGYLLGGVVITESIFSRPGIGRLLVNAVFQQDYPVVQGIAVWMAIVYVSLNLSADALIRITDPRVIYAAA